MSLRVDLLRSALTARFGTSRNNSRTRRRRRPSSVMDKDSTKPIVKNSSTNSTTKPVTVHEEKRVRYAEAVVCFRVVLALKPPVKSPRGSPSGTTSKASDSPRAVDVGFSSLKSPSLSRLLMMDMVNWVATIRILRQAQCHFRHLTSQLQHV